MTQACSADVPDWQPIETAPKDGTEIWAFNGEQARMMWAEGDGYALWCWADELLNDVDPDAEQPTHWMPLPAPPLPLTGAGSMSDLKKGDRVTVKVSGRSAFNGVITGEGRSGHWWMIVKDGTKCPNGYHKNFCRPEAPPADRYDSTTKGETND